MKKYLVSTLTLVALLGGSVSPALADEGSGIRGFIQKFRQEREDSRENVRDEQETNRQELKSNLEVRGADLRLKLEQERNKNRLERLTKFWEKAAGRLKNLIGLETKMADKIEARLKKFEDAGKDVGTQRTMLADARVKIAAAQTALDDAITELKKMKEDGKPIAEVLVQARELHKGVVAKIRDAHRALVDVIVSTRGMSVTPTPTP